MADLLELAEKIVKNGPHKMESTPRRVRGLFGGKYIFDTTQADYVWEHPYYPYFYIPISCFSKDALHATAPYPSSNKAYYIGRLNSGPSHTDRVIVFRPSSSPLSDLVRIEHSAISWFVEDEHILGSHPKDPYKRIETFPSSRQVRIEWNGVTIAESTQSVFLYETMLRPRYYLNPTSIQDWSLLVESETTSYCPYKGMANYYHLRVNGKERKDAVWYYKYPTSESALVAGRLCFYNEKVDVFVDGVKEE
ncbi:hypothetical protein BGZ60DRAFT_425645 [Tricladium varicosporioides]|nr:hypothetical protein BGZ60DRAFT_425645 [Hymenoscyphus varicosporioides]